MVPSPADLRMEQGCLPHEAYFARGEQISTAQARGRLAAEMITPYPPGIPPSCPANV
ncbi:hypothetical protein ACF073_23825 [Streptomyces sp. NPDC015171]|uniref:Orn/Lys/Arg family decarboxylase n=1 Tax=Streptomyces sp. NPDC015171 TaxID=3364945 RepID=UPI0036FDDFCD